MIEDIQGKEREKALDEDKRIIKREKLEIGERITYEIPNPVNEGQK